MHDVILYRRMFENATWILTHKHSGERTQYNYSEMCKVVLFQ